MADFEDAVQDAAAELAGIDTVVTRNLADFKNSSRRIIDPTTLLQQMMSTGPNP